VVGNALLEEEPVGFARDMIRSTLVTWFFTVLSARNSVEAISRLLRPSASSRSTSSSRLDNGTTSGCGWLGILVAMLDLGFWSRNLTPSWERWHSGSAPAEDGSRRRYRRAAPVLVDTTSARVGPTGAGHSTGLNGEVRGSQPSCS